MRLFLKLERVVENLMLGWILFQRIDPRALNDLLPITLLVLGTTKRVYLTLSMASSLNTINQIFGDRSFSDL